MDRVEPWGLRRHPAPTALPPPRAAGDCRHGAPTAMGGRSMAGAGLGAAFGLRGLQGVRQRRVGRGRQRGPHQAEALARRRMRLTPCWATLRPSPFGARRWALGQALTAARGHSDTPRGWPRAVRVRVRPERLPRLGRERRTPGPSQLGGPCLAPPWRRRRLLRWLQARSEGLPLADPSGRGRWRPPPGWLGPRWPGRFFPVRRLVSGATASSSAHATRGAAPLRQGQRSGAAGPGLPDQARPWAASSPGLVRRGAGVTGWRYPAAAPPSSPTRGCRGAPLLVDTSDAAAMAAVVPPQGLAALRHREACTRVRLGAWGLARRSRHAARAVSVKSPTYLRAIASP